MQNAGIRAGQVTQVRGFADQRLRIKQDPTDPGNRRISLIVQYLEKPVGGEPQTPAKDASAEAGKEPA